MNRPATAREALIAEAIGDMGRLMDRVEGASIAANAARQALDRTSAELAQQLASLDGHLAAITGKATTQAIRHIEGRTREVTSASVAEQTRAMHQASRQLFAEQVGPALQRLQAPLQRLVARLDRPWESWLTHAATAVVSSALTWVLVALPRAT